MYSAGYDRFGNYRTDELVNWSSSGTLDSIATIGTSLVFSPVNAPALGRILATPPHGVLPDSTGIITVLQGGLAEIRIQSQRGADQAVYGDSTISTDSTLTLFASGYDANGNYLGEFASDWTATGAIGSFITAMFVIDEEIGGNGSLDLALDKDLKSRYDSILILECAGNNIYPANRGAVYFKCEAGFSINDRLESGRKYSLLEAFVYAILEMEKEGEAILAESDHPLFPHRPVQTCNGIFGPYGNHPSTTCDEIKFILMNCDPNRGITKIFDKGLADYISKHGDKTTIKDPATGAIRLEKHFDCSYVGKNELEITVYGIAGHSGALRQNDAAITKWAYMMKALLDQKHEGKLDFFAELTEISDSKSLVLEGSQGFLPTHSINEVKQRISTSFDRGIRRYIKHTDLTLSNLYSEVTFNKLHNSAFACDPDSASMRSALKAGIQSGIIREENPVVGWDVSCDARLFAKEYPDMPVITAGVGNLIDAHGDDEKIYLPDLFDCIYFTILFLLMETGSLS